jgi:hypothetical protein
MDVTQFFGCPIYSSTDKLLIILFWFFVAFMLFVFILIASRLTKLAKSNHFQNEFQIHLV